MLFSLTQSSYVKPKDSMATVEHYGEPQGNI